MTCFWNAVLHGIPKELYEDQIHHNPMSLVMYLKARNRKTDEIKICGQLLNEQRKEENVEAIRCFDQNSIYHGYFCSTEDPFLFLIAEVFQISIYHTFLGKMFDYVHPHPKLKLFIHSNHGHMSFGHVEKL
jgi:hypothetical protein